MLSTQYLRSISLRRAKVDSFERYPLALLSRLHDLVLDDSQFIIATHSPILMAYPDASIIQCGKNGLSPIAYEDTDHFQVMRSFLCNPRRTLDILFER
jgi:predicted ATPase